MTSTTHYLFEGKQRTLREVWTMVPRLGLETVRLKLKAGATTRAEMLAEPKKRSKPSGWQRDRVVGEFGSKT